MYTYQCPNLLENPLPFRIERGDQLFRYTVWLGAERPSDFCG